MYEEETEEINNDDKSCPGCGLRQYSDICANCNTQILEEENPEKKKEDEDEYDYRERR